MNRKKSKAVKVKPVKVECLDTFEEPEVEVAEEEVSEEAFPLRCNRRLTHKRTAHIPGPRRKPNFVLGAVAEDTSSDEETDAARSAESVSEDEVVSDTGPVAPQPRGMEKPMCYGDVDG